MSSLTSNAPAWVSGFVFPVQEKEKALEPLIAQKEVLENKIQNAHENILKYDQLKSVLYTKGTALELGLAKMR